MNVLIDIGLIITYALLGVGFLALLFFSLKLTLSNIGKSKATLVGIAGFIVLFIISYALSSSTDLSAGFLEKNMSSTSTSKLIGSGLILTYFMFIAVIGSTIYAAISKMLK